MSLRQPVNFRLPKQLLQALHNYCDENELPYTAFIEAAIREKMQREKIPIPASHSYSNWRWKGNLEDMPFDIEMWKNNPSPR